MAVFLALGLGILIGSALPGSDVLARQQGQLANSLELQMNSLRNKNEWLQIRTSSLETEINMQRQFAGQILPALVGGKLEGHRLAVIKTGGYGMPVKLVQALQTAGAEIQSTTVFNGLEAQNTADLLARLNWAPSDGKKMAAAIGAEISGAITGGDTTRLELLAAEGILKTDGQYRPVVDGVVLVGGSPDRDTNRVDCLDYPLIDYFKARQITVYGVEESDAACSYMGYYHKKGIATVDNIDTIPGQVSLIYAISGKHGRYGIKSSAQTLLPAVESGVTGVAR